MKRTPSIVLRSLFEGECLPIIVDKARVQRVEIEHECQCTAAQINVIHSERKEERKISLLPCNSSQGEFAFGGRKHRFPFSYGRFSSALHSLARKASDVSSTDCLHKESRMQIDVDLRVMDLW